MTVGEIARQILYVPFYAGIERKLFDDEGISVDLRTTLGPDRTTSALHGGEVQMTLQGPESVIYTAGDPAFKKVRMFAALTRTDGAFLVARDRVPMEKFRWESIKGKTLIGRYRASTPGLFLDFALRNRGIDPSGDIKLRADIAVPVRARIWRSGVGDFATFYEPQVTRLEQEGKGFPVASIGKEVGSVDFTVFIATETYLEKHPAVVQGWVNAVQKSLSWTTRTTPKEIASLVAHYFRRADEATLTRAIERYMSIDLWKTDPTISRKSVADLQSMMIESRVIDSDRRVAYERIVEPRFAEQAHRSAGSRD